MSCIYNPNTGRFNQSLTGKSFISYNHKGKMMRRGVVLRKCLVTYLVGLVDVFCGADSGERRRYYEPEMQHWHFFDTVEECNQEYEEYFANQKVAA